MAGRTFLDLNQYPVLPWILSDYTTEEIDFHDMSIYRDLSKPIGAISKVKEQQYRERYELWDDPEIPKFHYGTHYSSASIVLQYLIRLEPFTQHNLRFYGGKFDHPDRIFHSIQDTWRILALPQTSDVKELIPEFFYLPEFLTNGNHLDLGVKSNDKEIGDVILPEWAQNDPREFIRIHRQLLESDFVSANIHSWIDLIFGYKQQGKEAEKAVNVFYYLTYEGKVNFEEIENPLVKEATIEQIRSFGQTPRPIFEKPHPVRLKSLKQGNLYSGHMLVPMEMYSETYAIGRIIATSSVKEFLPLCNTLSPVNKDYALCWGMHDGSLEIYNMTDINLDPILVKDLHSGKISCCVMAENGERMVTGGQDTVLRVWTFGNSSSLIQWSTLSCDTVLAGHNSEIVALDISLDYNLIVSASVNRVVIVWDLYRLMCAFRFPVFESAVVVVKIEKISGDILVVTETCVYLYTVNGAEVCRLETGMARHTTGEVIAPHALGIQNIDYSNLVILGHESGEISIWEVVLQNTWKFRLRHVLKEHENVITALFLHGSHNGIWSGDEQGQVIHWDVPAELLKKDLDNVMKKANKLVPVCSLCSHRFKTVERRRFCRKCSDLHCESCYLEHIRGAYVQ